MAKSIRSKHKRKMRGVKRQHYAKKDAERLQRIAKRADDELAELVTMKTAKELKEQMDVATTQIEEDSKMEMEGSSKKVVHDEKTKKDENGHYPQWMNQRAVKKHKKKMERSNKGKKLGFGRKIKW